MVLNRTSYTHLSIRKLCSQLELLSGMSLITNLDEEFVELRFMNKYGYIVIDWRKNAIFTLSHKLVPVEYEIATTLIVYCDWLEVGENIRYMKGGNNYGNTSKYEGKRS